MIRCILVRQALLCILPCIMVAQEQPTSQQALPAWVETAIRYGTKEKKVSPIELIGKFGNMRYYGNVTTSFLRVALAAHEAKDKYMKFEPSQVTPEMIAPVIVLTVPPNFGVKMRDRRRDARHAIIRPRKSKGSDGVIQPLHVSTFTDTAQNLGGATIVKQGIRATSRLEAFREDNKIVLIFEDKEYGFDIGKIMFEKGHVSITEQSATPSVVTPHGWRGRHKLTPGG
jgi:hypothetical protein